MASSCGEIKTLPSDEEESNSEIPDKETCQKLVEEFASVTSTDEALAQFFLQDHSWNLELSLNAFYEARSDGDVDAGADSDILVTFQSSGSSLVSLPLPGIITAKPPSKFSLMTWNLDGLDEHNLKKRTKAVAKIIELQKPDIVFLQEVIPATYSYLEDHLPHYMFIAGGTEDYFVATLLFRTTVYFDGHFLHPFPNSRMRRNLLFVDCHIGSLKLRLLNSHLESTQEFTEERKHQLRSAINLLKSGTKEHTSILGGDLNLRDKEVKEIQLPPDIFDLWESCGQRKECKYTWDTLRNTNKSFPGKFKPRMRFDRVYLYQGDPPSVQPSYFGLVGLEKVSGTQSFPSDHWGIIIRFDIPNQRAFTSSPPPSHSAIKKISNFDSSSSSKPIAETVDCFDISVDEDSSKNEETSKIPVEIVECDDSKNSCNRKRNHSLIELD